MNYNYTKLSPFKWFILENFPFIEADFDAITNWQLFCKLGEEMNKVIDSVNLSGSQVELLTEAFNELQNYVNDYFSNLDVQDEINNKLDEMAEDGTLYTLISKYVDPQLKILSDRIDYVDEKISSVYTGSPIPVNSISQMTDTSKTYLLLSDGNWYWYNGTTWVSGGQYQAVEIGVGQITEKNLSSEVLNDFSLYELNNSFPTADRRIGTYNSLTSAFSCIFKPNKYFKKGTKIQFTGDSTVYRYAVTEIGAKHSDLDISVSISNIQIVTHSNWLNGDEIYETKYNGFILVTYAYIGTSRVISEEELAICDKFFLYKLSNEKNEEYIRIEDSVNMGNKVLLNNFVKRIGLPYNRSVTYCCCLMLDMMIPSGSKIVCNLDNHNFRWSVITARDTYFTTDVRIHDTGWRTTSGSYAVTEDCFVYLNLSAPTSSDTFAEEDLHYLDELFTIIPNNQLVSLENKVDTFEVNTQKINYVVSNKNVKSVNHRGYNSIAPENTLPAFILSKKMGFEYVETDISYTLDGIPVCIHDTTIDRTSNGTGTVANMTYEQLLQYDFGSWKSLEYTGTKIPTFDEFMSLCKELGLKPYVEFKNNVTDARVVELLNIAKKYQMLENTTWIGGAIGHLRVVANNYEKSRLGLIQPINSNNINAIKSIQNDNNYVFFDWDLNLTSDDNVNDLIDNDIPLEVWIVDSETDIINSNKYISGYTSNYTIAGDILVQNYIN